MGFLNVKTNYSVYKNCMLRLGRYMSDGSLAVEIYNRQDGEIARLTTCLCDPTLPEDVAYVDTNNCPWAVASLRKMVWQRRQGEQKEVNIVFIRQ